MCLATFLSVGEFLLDTLKVFLKMMLIYTYELSLLNVVVNTHITKHFHFNMVTYLGNSQKLFAYADISFDFDRQTSLKALLMHVKLLVMA